MFVYILYNEKQITSVYLIYIEFLTKQISKYKKNYY
jgi:hypothetical protein